MASLDFGFMIRLYVTEMTERTATKRVTITVDQKRMVVRENLSLQHLVR